MVVAVLLVIYFTCQLRSAHNSQLRTGTDQGVVVARRTVSKYRGMMKVPPAELRRQV